MAGLFGILDGMRRLSGILNVLFFNIISKLILFSPASNKNLVNVMASGLFPNFEQKIHIDDWKISMQTGFLFNFPS